MHPFGRSLFSMRVAQFLLAIVLMLPVVADRAVAQLAFDHYTTGFRLDGAHRFADCESCHADGMFSGTPVDCSGCHTQASRVNATSQPAFHIPTSDRCAACHRADTWVATARIDHFEVQGTCSSCHNGQKAGGQPFDHLPTGNQCDDCHRTTAWVPAVFDHAGIVGGCFSCHNGMIAMGKPADHIPATNLCEDCHNTITWSPVNRVNHLQVLGTCSGCHNGIIAMGQHPQHIPTSAECDGCHNTIAWR